MEEIFFAGGCLWGVQEFIRHLPGVISTEAGRANGSATYHKLNMMAMLNVSEPFLIHPGNDGAVNGIFF